MGIEAEHPIVSLAIELANKYHAGQIDKSGRPYLGHLERTATKVRFSGGSWIEESAAWLHDVIEDTRATKADLLEAGLPMAVVQIVDVMTHSQGVTNEDYWQSIRAVSGAVPVKLADIYDNLDPARMCYLPEDKQRRLRRKYANAILVLCGEPDV